MLLSNTLLKLTVFILMIGVGYSVEALTCHVCSSDKLAICATLQMIQREDLPFELCPPNVESCFSRIENGITIRGCSPVHKKNSLKADHYETCETDKCNGEIFPEHRLHCVHCADENCVNQTDTIDVRHPCVIYDDNDKCYSVFSPDGSVAYRGCHSEPVSSFGRAFCKQHSDQCVECSTLACTDDPFKTSKKNNDNDLKVKKLHPSQLNWLFKGRNIQSTRHETENESNNVSPNRNEKIQLSTCFGDNCSEKIQLFNCHSCDSAKDRNCAIKPNKTPSVKCNHSKTCHTQIENGAVRRGCTGDENIPQIEMCLKPICTFCEGKTNCNDKRVPIEKCIKCDSEHDEWCHSNANGSESRSEDCNFEVTQQGCYHYINPADGLMKRGCVNKLLPQSELLSDCKSDSDTCKICHGNDCNSKKSFSKCLQCNYLKETKCAINTSNMRTKLCRSYADECFTFIENKNLIRGCMDELTSESLKKCLDDNDMCEKCDPTDKAGCNNGEVRLERCIECDSNKDGENCRNDLKSFEGRICNGLQPWKPQGCFISIDGDHYKRGCISKLSKDDKEKCLNQSDTCKSTFGTNSNKKNSFLKCYKCDSRDEPECSRSSTSKTDTEICQHLDATCTTGIDDHGVTHRRCSKDASDEQKFFKYYKICSTSKCNGGIFPPDRLQCYQCNGIDECNLMPKDSNRSPNAKAESSNSLKPLACNVLSTYDQCYTYIDEDDQMHRGCLTDASDSRLLCELNETICIKCNKSGCNNQPKFREPSFSCIHCNDRLECAYGQDETKLKHCTERVLFNVKESCYGRKNPDGKSFVRGCTEDLNKENADAPRPDRMAMCFEPGCNKQNIILDKCQICSSQIGGDCGSVRGRKNFTATCDGESYPYSQRGCYTYVKNDQVERGCVKNLKERCEECVQDTTSCVICETDNCNIDDRSFGHRINSNILLNVLAIFVIFWYY